jgi:tripeptidyl-peptidase-1
MYARFIFSLASTMLTPAYLKGGVHGQRNNISECDNKTLTPTFPSTCPYLTAVGGTEGFGPEVGVDFSSGGFSNYFPAPAYQSS